MRVRYKSSSSKENKTNQIKQYNEVSMQMMRLELGFRPGVGHVLPIFELTGTYSVFPKALPFVGWVIVVNTAFNVFQSIQHSKHIDELSEGQQIWLGPEFCLFLLLA